MFTKSEKDKVSIEHILPQTPTKYYLRNMFRQFKDSEIKILSGALGNLLPLSQSVNSALQNDSFEDKKHSKTTGCRGYENGSHSEIEVSKLQDWTAFEIYSRIEKLLVFMQERWNLQFDEEQLEKLIGISFVKDGREIPEELEEVSANTPECEESAEDSGDFDRITTTLSMAGEHLSLSGGSSETRFEIRKRYWTYALVQIHEAHGNLGSFSNVNPSTDNAIRGLIPGMFRAQS